jgi:hypothetical protein
MIGRTVDLRYANVLPVMPTAAQEAILGHGLLQPVCGLVTDVRLDETVRTAAVRLLAELLVEHPAAQAAALAAGVVPALAVWLEDCLGSMAAAAGGATADAAALSAGEAAPELAALLAVLAAAGPATRRALVEARGLSVLVRALQASAACAGLAAHRGCPCHYSAERTGGRTLRHDDGAGRACSPWHPEVAAVPAHV